MSEYREMWAARKQAAETAMNDADARELQTLSSAYRKARDVADFFGRNVGSGDSLNLYLGLRDSNGHQNDAVNALLRATTPKNKELADSIWCQCNEAIKKAHDDNTTLVMENLRTMGIALPKSIA